MAKYFLGCLNIKNEYQSFMLSRTKREINYSRQRTKLVCHTLFQGMYVLMRYFFLI